jgi:hypothetical protein
MLAPMNFTPRPISKHQRAKLIAWTLAMLVWLVQMLFGAVVVTPRHERQRARAMSIERLTRRVKMLIISRAIDLSRRRWRGGGCAHAGRRVTVGPGALRVLLGARVHRWLARKDIGERIAVLIYTLQHLDECAAFVAKRLKRGLTRRWLALFAIEPPRAILLVSLAEPRAIIADSS